MLSYLARYPQVPCHNHTAVSQLMLQLSKVRVNSGLLYFESITVAQKLMKKSSNKMAQHTYLGLLTCYWPANSSSYYSSSFSIDNQFKGPHSEQLSWNAAPFPVWANLATPLLLRRLIMIVYSKQLGSYIIIIAKAAQGLLRDESFFGYSMIRS